MRSGAETFVVLARGINVGGRNKLPMSDLRSICARSKCQDVQTYIQSGNVVLRSELSSDMLETRLERGIEKQFGFSITVIARTAKDWMHYVTDNPFSGEAASESKWVLLSLSKVPPRAEAESELQGRATRGERVIRRGDAMWTHFPKGIGNSKLSAAVFDRHVGSPVTARNWNTVLRLHDMARETTVG